MKHNSDFSHDLKVGKLYERTLDEILSRKLIEVKRDFGATKTGNVFIEYESRGKPSGISHTKADYYCIFIDDDRFIFISTELLRSLCRKYWKNSKRNVEGGDSNTSKGILLPIKDLIN